MSGARAFGDGFAAGVRERDLCESLFAALAEAGGGGLGVTRDSYGVGETAALEAFVRAAAAAGLKTERDAAANLVVTLKGLDAEAPFIACGSHLDSVPQGGNFDGGAGVVAGFALLAGLKADGIVPQRTIKLFALRGEEGAWFGRPYIGSSALFGRLSKDDLALKRFGRGDALGDCMREVGANVDRIARGEPLLDASTVAAWIELHIEQGPVLLDRDIPLGIVTGIRGNIRHLTVRCTGEAGHSGAVPRRLRRDPVFATAALIMRLDRLWQLELERGGDLAVTCGMFGTDPAEHAVSRIPAAAGFSLDLRSQNPAMLEAFHDLVLLEAAAAGQERGVDFRFDRPTASSPAVMDDGWIEQLRRAARDLGLPDQTLPSGAGHDAAVFANAGVPSAMIFIRNEHGSHNPRESLDMDDFLAGLAVMRRAILAGPPS